MQSIDNLVSASDSTRETRERVGVPTLIVSFILVMAMFPGVTSAQWTQLGGDIDGEAAGDLSAFSVALTPNGTRVVVGAPYNIGTGMNSGHVRVWDYYGGSWHQRGDDIDGEAPNDFSGHSVALAGTGNLVAVGAPENSGLNGYHSGHVRVFKYLTLSFSWVQVGADIDGEADHDGSGSSVALSSDGSCIAIGAPQNDGANGSLSGHVRVWDWNGAYWHQRGSDIDGEAPGDNSGRSVALSPDGITVAVGATLNDSNGVDSGHVRVFDWNGTFWEQRGLDLEGEAADDRAGTSVALTQDGNTVVIGALFNDGNGDNSGHARVFDWGGSSWVQRGNDIDGEAAGDLSGVSVALSHDGNTVAVGAPLNNSSGADSGHVRVFVWSGTSWVQRDPSIEGEAVHDQFGGSVALSSNGSHIAIGATGNDGNGDHAGHVRVFFHVLFADGFETGGTSAWSAVAS